MKKLSEATVIVRDYGKFGPMIAERLSREFGRVLLDIRWEKEFPNPIDYHVGEGIPGVERIYDFWKVWKEADVIVFPDLLEPGLQNHLRELGKAVWGGGYAETLETDRWGFRKWLNAQDMPRGETERVVGIEALRDVLRLKENRYVKIPKFRGAGETFPSKSYDLVEPYLNELEHNLGIYSKTQEFIVDGPLEDKEEIGIDIFTVDGKYPSVAAWGFEVKDEAHIEKVELYASIPKQLRYVNEKLSPEFAKFGSRGFFGTEVRIGKDGLPYFIDPAIRACFPPIEGILEAFENWGEIILAGANGEMITPKPTMKYFALARMHSEFSLDKAYPIHIKPEDIQWVKLPDFTVRDGMRYVLPRRGDWDMVGTVVGHGDTAQKAVEDCEKRAERIEGVKLDISTKHLKGGLESIKRSAQMGIRF